MRLPHYLFKTYVVGVSLENTKGENMGKKTAGIIGLIGGLLILTSVALPWVSISYMGTIYSGSGIDYLLTGGETLGMAALVLIGGLLALVGGCGLLMTKGPVKLLLVGGMLPIVGGIWSQARIFEAVVAVKAVVEAVWEFPFAMDMKISPGGGIFLAVFGAMLALAGFFDGRGKQ
jgi:hypothetical protein